MTANKEVCTFVLRVKLTKKRKRGEEGSASENIDRYRTNVDQTCLILENGRKVAVELLRLK